MFATRVLAPVAFCLSCASSSPTSGELPDATTGDCASQTSDAPLAAIDGGAECRISNGTEKCSRSCPSCGDGVLCIGFEDRAGDPAPFNICDYGLASIDVGGPCTGCSTALPLCSWLHGICVSQSLCEGFASEGFPQACIWADKTNWTPGETIAPPACDCPADGILCGGSCGDCASGEVCSGRSPTHPFGVCVAKNSRDCRRDGSLACPSGFACLTYVVEAANQTLADENGTCLPVDRCAATGRVLPGGANCTGSPGAGP